MSEAVSLPEWYPDWTRELAELYFSGSTCLFLLHGNIADLMPNPHEPTGQYVSLIDFLGTGLFGSWDIALRYDLGHGLRVVAGEDSENHQEMVRTVSGYFGEKKQWPSQPDEVLASISALVERNLLQEDTSRQFSMVFILDYAQYLVPATEISQLAGSYGARLVRLLEWAQNPYIKRINMAFVLVTEKLSEINSRLVNHSHVATIEIPMPQTKRRLHFLETQAEELKPVKDYSAEQFSQLANGLSLTSIDRLIDRAKQAGKIEESHLKQMKKTLIERQCQGLIEFVEPNHTLDLVVGHTAGKQRLREDAELLSAGNLDAAPMGYLFCGSVGTGKTFLAECYAGTIGIPCVKLKNFRSKYVGETEGNLERILTVLRALGPVIVIIDEADAALGNRGGGNDSGVSSRVFSMIASQMGNTDYRGKILWMLLTCRPDLLPIDLKRQGRAEVHLPLFYPQSVEEIRKMFLVMARKNKIKLEPEELPEIPENWEVSGADIESIVITANRRALLQKRKALEKADLEFARSTFLPSVQGLEKEMQEIAAVLECTQLEFLPDEWRKIVTRPEGRSELQTRLVTLKHQLSETHKSE